ncbi:MAG: glycosyltransferase family 2 protein [Elusimicrobiota bacterium]
MVKISFSIIGHNEADFIEGCFESLKDIAYEIIYVDCQSSDNSVEIAKKYTDKIFYRENNLNLNVNKQFGIEHCIGDWIFYIDPDERLTEELKKEILKVLEGTEYNGFLISRKNYYLGKWIKYGGKYPDRQLRLFKNGKGVFECKSIHERIKVDGKIGLLKEYFEHIVVKDLKHMVSKMDSYINRGAIEMIRLNRKPSRVLFRSIRNFFINYLFKFGFLDGKIGFFVALIDLLNGFFYYFKVKEIEGNKRI